MTKTEIICCVRDELLTRVDYDADDIWSVCNLAAEDNLFYSLINDWMKASDEGVKRGVWNLCLFALKENRKKNL